MHNDLNAYPLSELADDEKQIIVMDTPDGPRKEVVVNEKGLRKLIALCPDRKVAKRFERWFEKELPALAREGIAS
jgi:prophage antirepressor-like protein